MEMIKQPHGGAICKPAKGETNNPNGRPKKGFSAVNAQLQKEGYEPAKKVDYEAMASTLITMPLGRVQEIANDDNQPILLRIIARELLGGKRFQASELILDRIMGKATQKTEVEHSGSLSILSKDIKQMTPEELEQAKKALLS